MCLGGRLKPADAACCCMAFFFLCLGIGGLAASTTVGDEAEIKVSYLYNFAKFIRWPAHPRFEDISRFRICTEGVGPLSASIQVLENRLLNGRPIEIVHGLMAADGVQACELAYIGISAQPHYPAVLQKIARTPTLTVSDIPDFIQQGGMIGLMVRENRVRFAINLRALQAAGLSADSQLLKLAVEVAQ